MPYDKTEYYNLKTDIKGAEPLPEDFYELFQIVYGNTNTDQKIVKTILKGRDTDFCPCTSASWASMLSRNGNIGKRKYMHDSYALSWKLERQFSQKECLAYLMQNYEIVNNTKGLHEAAVYYHKKPWNTLTKSEQLSIIVMIENPSTLNPRQHPKANQEAVDRYMLEIKK